MHLIAETERFVYFPKITLSKFFMIFLYPLLSLQNKVLFMIPSAAYKLTISIISNLFIIFSTNLLISVSLKFRSSLKLSFMLNNENKV